MIECPRCKGEGEYVGLACPGARVITITCPDCGGAGVVSEQQIVWQQEGARLRAYRMAGKISMREAAKAAGVKVTEWNDAEFGRVDPAWIVEIVAHMGGVV